MKNTGIELAHRGICAAARRATDARRRGHAHTHDEISVMVDEDKADTGRDALLAVMLAVPDWAEGLPIAADSTVAEFYTKTVEG